MAGGDVDKAVEGKGSEVLHEIKKFVKIELILACFSIILFNRIGEDYITHVITFQYVRFDAIEMFPHSWIFILTEKHQFIHMSRSEGFF